VLKQRILTVLLLVPLVLAAIFALPAQWFLILLAIIFLGGSWEYRRLAGFSGHPTGYFLVPLQAVILAVLFSFRDSWDSNVLVYLSASCITWLLMFIRLSLYHSGTKPDNTYRLVSFITAILSVTTGWFAFSWIRMQPEGSWLILLLLLTVWAADTGAYFAGKTFGKNKLAPHISPGKTKEGLLGGLIAAPLVALISLITALVSVGGDLMVSLHKRTSGFKDSSKLLPGHGGVLDRIDSLLSAAPFFALGLLVSGF